MNTSINKRISALEDAGNMGAVVFRVVPFEIADDEVRLAEYRAEAERSAPVGARVVLVITGVPRADEGAQ